MREQYLAQQRLIVTTLALTRREWATMGADFDASWARIGQRITVLTAAAQLGAARAGAASVPATLAELGQSVDPLGEVDPRAFAGVASDGRPLDSLLYGAVTATKAAKQTTTSEGQGMTVTYSRVADGAALAVGGRWLDMAIHTQVADASRAAAGVAITARPGIGWERMVNPPCCSRCAVLAGKVFKWNQGFKRHPRCDCTHVACGERAKPGLTNEPPLNQITGLTKGDRAAIGEGADLNQVLNAHRGFQGGKDAFQSGMETAEGTTRRGVFGGYIRGADGSVTRRARGTANPQRLTPNGIFRLASDRAEAVKLLRRFGYFL